MIKHFIIYLMPGSFMSETSSREVLNWGVQDAIEAAPKNAFCFYFKTMEQKDGVWGGPKEIDRSGTYFLGGEVFSYADIPDTSKYHTLRSNMKSNGWDYVIKCRTGNYQPFASDKGDVLIRV